MFGRSAAWWVMVTLVCLAPWPAFALRAQTGAGADPRGQADAGAIRVEVEQFGLMNLARPGEWVGIEFALLDRSSGPSRNVAVRLLVNDANGDTLVHERRDIALTPGIERDGVWLYAVLPWETDAGTRFTITVVDQESGVQLDAERLTPPDRGIVPAEKSLVGVFGGAPLGLDAYELGGGPADAAMLPVAHESYALATNLHPSDVPDSWLGLLAYESLIWSELPAQALIEGPRAQAMRDWVRAGGHLVIVLPGLGQTWFGADHPLSTILPEVDPLQRTAATLEPYRQWLSGPEHSAQPMPSDVPIHVFARTSETRPGEAIPVIESPEGIVAVRRMVGNGAVTVVGLEVTRPEIWQGGGLRADRFWHRLLGERFDTPSPEETSTQGLRVRGVSGGDRVWLDEALIRRWISAAGSPGLGVIVALPVFAAFWVISGPLGFGVLKWLRLDRHAWVMFAGITAVFAVIAWLGATAIRPTAVQATHLTILTEVRTPEAEPGGAVRLGGRLGSPVDPQRIRTWASVFLPSYGDTRVSLGEPDRGSGLRAISPWSSSEGSSPLSFPDARRYVQDMVRSGELTMPSRATVQQVRGDYSGSPTWTMPFVADDDAPTLLPDGRLRGRLRHNLPAPMQDVVVVLIEGQQPVGAAQGAWRRGQTGVLLSRGRVWGLTASLREWESGETLDLSLLSPTRGNSDTLEDWLEQLVPRTRVFGTLPPPPTDARARDMLAMFSTLEQPNYAADDTGQSSLPARVGRRDTRLLDGAMWTTSPCLMILGTVNGETPMPLMVGGEGRERTIPSEGVTFVRWVYPLKGRPMALPDEPESDRLRREARQELDRRRSGER